MGFAFFYSCSSQGNEAPILIIQFEPPYVGCYEGSGGLRTANLIFLHEAEV
jgi:hypothetical protein